MRQQTGSGSAETEASFRGRTPGRRAGLPAGLLAVAALALIAAGCSGERPELILAEDTTPETTVETTTTLPTVALQASDCVTATGPGPWRVAIEATPTAPIPCIELANHQRVEFVNNTTDPISFGLAGLSVTIEPATSFVTEPAGTFLQPGLTELGAVPHPVSGLWVTDPSENTFRGQLVGLNSIGEVSIGATPADAAATLNGASLNPAEGACYVTSIAGDPYSPLFTVADGAISVIQVFTPGQLTRSEIGVGSSEGDVLAVYGQQIESLPSADGDPNAKLLVFVPNDEADQQYRLAFELQNDMVVGVRNGLTNPTLTNPGCAG